MVSIGRGVLAHLEFLLNARRYNALTLSGWRDNAAVQSRSASRNLRLERLAVASPHLSNLRYACALLEYAIESEGLWTAASV
jgi:hypothetical protein